VRQRSSPPGAWLCWTGSSAVVRCLVPSDVAAAGPGRGDSDAGLDGDLDGAGPDGHRDGLAGVGQAGLDSVAADQLSGYG
jgi:hypothetical protein